MKPFAFLLLSSGLLGACQQADTKTAATTPAQSAVRVVPTGTSPAAPLPPAARVAELTPAARAVLQAADLAPLFLPGADADSPEESAAGQAMNGFFGAEHRRIELVFLQVTRDAANPGLYHVQGKDRFKKRITPFEGTLQLQHVKPLKPLEGNPNEDLLKAYAATGQFELRETGAGSGLGVFRGRVALDFGLTDSNKAVLAFWGFDKESTAAKGAGSRFEGQWTSQRTGEQKPVLWADGAGLFDIAQDIFADFNVGERGPAINPKYARLGWENYWENDEWWAETPTTVSL
jgi:hypothetical protein